MKKGKVKWYDEVKGYGFIQAETGEDVFVHRSGIVNSRGLEADQNVEFEAKTGEKGIFAVNVTPLK